MNFFLIPSNGVIRATLHFQFYFELKEKFKAFRIENTLKLVTSRNDFHHFWYFFDICWYFFDNLWYFFKKIRIFVKLFFVNFQNFEKNTIFMKILLLILFDICWYFKIRKKEIPNLSKLFTVGQNIEITRSFCVFSKGHGPSSFYKNSNVFINHIANEKLSFGNAQF